MNDLSKREKDFIRLLFDETEYQPISYYSKKLKVSTKTLQTDLKKIRSFLKKYGIVIHAVSGKGILIDSNAQGNTGLLNDISGPDGAVAEESSQTRREMILKQMLLRTNEMTSIQKLSDMYYIGKTSIANDMKYIEDWLKKYDLGLKKTKEGTCISGSEQDIRKAIAGLALRENTRNGLLDLFEREDIDFIENLLASVEKKELDIGDIYYTNLLTHILICIKRVRENIHIDNEGSGRMISAYTLERYQRAKEIAKRINEHYGIQIGEGETYYIYQYLISSGYERDTIKEQVVDAEADISTIFARKLTGRLSEIFGVDFEKDKDMIQGLILHIRPMLNRLEYNISINNPMMEEISRHYPEMVANCRMILEELEQEYHLTPISMDEAVNIAIYYQTMLEKIVMHKRVVVVCHSGYGTSQLLAAKLKNEFAFMDIVDVVSARKVKGIDLSDVDYIISTVPMERDDVPYIVVSSLLSEQDIKMIRNHMMQLNAAEKCEEKF